MSEKSCDTCLYQGPFNKDECYAEQCNGDMDGWRNKDQSSALKQMLRNAMPDNSGPCIVPNCNLTKLIDDHWKYVEDMLRVHGTEEEAIAIVGFHYKSAFRHGFKHCMEHYEIEEQNNE